MRKYDAATGLPVRTRTEIALAIMLAAVLIGSLFLPVARDFYADLYVAIATGIMAVLEGIWDVWLWILNS